jgi:hypothetical protein
MLVFVLMREGEREGGMEWGDGNRGKREATFT